MFAIVVCRICDHWVLVFWVCSNDIFFLLWHVFRVLLVVDFFTTCLHLPYDLFLIDSRSAILPLFGFGFHWVSLVCTHLFLLLGLFHDCSYGWGCFVISMFWCFLLFDVTVGCVFVCLCVCFLCLFGVILLLVVVSQVIIAVWGLDLQTSNIHIGSLE